MVKFFKNREFKNVGWIIGERVMQLLISLIIGALTARYLGPSNYGSLNYTASFVSFFSSIATLGMEGVIIKKMIAEPDAEGDYLGGCLLLRLLSSTFSSVSIVVIVFILNPDDSSKILLAFLQSLQLIFQSVSILDSWFQRYFKSKYVSIGKFLAYLLMSIYKIILLCTAKSVAWFAFANSLSSFVIAVVLIYFYKLNKGPRITADIKRGMSVLTDSYHYILSGLMVALYSQMDKIMIGKMMTDMDVGFYTAATTICNMWIFIPMALIQSFRPTIMELKQSGDNEKYGLRLRQLYSAVIWLCIGVSAVVCIGAPLIIRILYGADYMEASATLRIVIWFETFSMIGTARGVWILCENLNKYVKYYLGIGSVANVIMNALMIPLLGIEGAAIATLFTQIITSLIAPLLFKETRMHTKIVWESFCFSWFFKQRKVSNQKKLD